ncbi:hypothetical protein AURDEDRAFT_130188 [Auricularia subglabra TFB-10046 SS5]|nr:hypothetical protein AURDEDRAFT_130188 [Auricularia subglabra TFB-10046 SS5]
MAFTRPASFDEFAFAICASWATQIRKALLGEAGYPGHAPPNYGVFHDANPHAISAERGNAAIDAAMARVQRTAQLDQEFMEEERAEQQRERDNDKLAIPVAALKIILDHDTTVARLHTTQIQAAVATRRTAPPPPPRFWYNKRFRGGRGRGGRSGVNQFRPRYNPEGKSNFSATRAPFGDVSMREATPVASGSAATPTFGANLTNFMFGEFASTSGSTAFPTRAAPPGPSTPSASVAPSQYEEDFEDYDMADGAAPQDGAESVTNGLADMALSAEAVSTHNEGTD